MNDTKLKQLKGLLAKAIRYERNHEYDKALKYSLKSMRLAKSISDFECQIESLLLQQKSYWRLGKVNKSRLTEFQIMGLHPSEKQLTSYLDAILEMAVFHLNVLEYFYATKLVNLALQGIRDNEYVHLEGRALSILADLHHKRGNYASSIALGFEALKMAEASDNKTLIIAIKNQIGHSYAAANDFVSALELLEAVERQVDRKKNYLLYEQCLIYKSEIYGEIGDFDKAERMCFQFLHIEETESVVEPEIIRVYGTLLAKTRQFQSALDWWGHCEKLALKRRFVYILPSIYFGYSSTYFHMGSFESSLTYLFKAIGMISHNYFEAGDFLKSSLEQLYIIYEHLHRSDSCELLSSMIAKLQRLQGQGIDSSDREAQAAESLKCDLDALISSMKSDTIGIFSRDGIWVDLNTGVIYGNGKRSIAFLTDIQRRILELMVCEQGNPVSNSKIIGCYDKSVDGMIGMPRRAHYFIREIRRKLGKKGIIQTVKGVGYMIPLP